MKTLMSLLAILLLFYSGTFSGGLNGKVRVRLHVNKAQFVSGEFIFIDCSVQNLLGREVQIPEVDHHHTERFLSLVNSRNERVPYGIIPGTLGEYPNEILPPNSKIVRTFSLSAFGNTNSFTGVVRNLEPGLYRVWLTLNDVQSDTIKIEITKPTPQDRAFAERLSTRVNNYPKIPLYAAIEEAKALIRANPNSPYVPNAYFHLMSALHYSDNPQWNTVDLKRVAEEYMSRFPDFGGIEDAVHFFAFAVQNSIGGRHKRELTVMQLSTIESELRALKARHAGGKVGRYVDEKITSLKQMKSR